MKKDVSKNMRIAFYYNAIAGYEHLGVESLSAVLKENGFQVKLIMDTSGLLNDIIKERPWLRRLSKNNETEEKIISEIKAFNPDIVCHSVLSENYASSIKYAKIFKERLGKEILNIVGGIHATSVPEIIIKNSLIDFVIVGEGELSLLQLIEAIEGKRSFEKVQNLVFKKNSKTVKNKIAPYVRNLDSLPLPDKDIFYDKIPVLAKDYYIMISRGCPFSCAYCCNSLYHNIYNFEKNHIRRRSVKHVMSELVIAKKKYRPKTISFLDEMFVFNKKDWLYPFLEEYVEKINLPYYCQLHPEQIDAELAHHLARSNCWNVTVGVQSGSSRIRNEIYKRRTSNEKVVEACKIIKQNKMFLTLDIILGCPTEEEKDLERTIEIMEQIVPDRIASFFLAYYPGTEITQKAVESNYLPLEIENAYKEGSFGATHYALKLPGEFALPLDKRKYWICKAKLQTLCIIKNIKITRIFYRFIEKINTRVLITLSKILTVFASLINFDKRGYQRIRVIIGAKRVP